MIITIEGLNNSVAKQMTKDCGVRIFNSRTQGDEGLTDVTINPSATMKVYDDVIFFDLCGNLTSVHRQDFHEITIT